MSLITVTTKDSVQAWVEKTNQIAVALGDISNLGDSIVEEINSALHITGDVNDLDVGTTLPEATNEIRHKAIVRSLMLGSPMD